MQKTFSKGKWCIDIDTVNPKFCYYNLEGKQGIFIGVLQIYHYGGRNEYRRKNL